MTGNNIIALDHGRLQLRSEFLAVLQANALDTFENVMGYADGRVMRSVPGRSTVRAELKRSEGEMLVVYLKRYESEYLSTGHKLLRWLHWPGASDEALHEWDAMEQLRAHGFNTATPVAIGQQKTGGLVTRSFLMTAEIVGGIAAHGYMRTLEATARRELVGQIAELTRAFHDAGFAHRDYYLSHIFVVNSPGGSRHFYFIDLQRLFRPRFFRERWVVKDLGALGYSAQLSGATRADLLRFYKVCFAMNFLSVADRALIRKIMSRVNALHRRGPKYDVIWDQPGVRPPNV